MDLLKKYFEEMKFKNIETYIASGNIIFECDLKNEQIIENRIENHLLKSLGYIVDAFVRTISQVKNIAEYKPFNELEFSSAKALNVAFLKEPLIEGQKNKLESLQSEIDFFHANGKEVYWLCKKKQSESLFSNSVFEKSLKTKATFRGINTVNKLASKYSIL